MDGAMEEEEEEIIIIQQQQQRAAESRPSCLAFLHQGYA